MKIIALTKYDTLGASSRMRILQYIPTASFAEHQIEVSSLFSNAYVSDLQKNRRNLFSVLLSYLKRIKILITLQKDVDLIWIEKECLPWLPHWMESVFLPSNIPYVIDYDDAVYHWYDQHPNLLVRLLLAKKHPQLIKNSSLIISGNQYLQDFALKSQAKKAAILPTVVDLHRYQVHPKPNVQEEERILNFGWIGQQSTAYNLMSLESLFSEFSSQKKIVFSAIGIDAKSLGLSMSSVDWSEETEVQNLLNYDVGMMPLMDGPFESGKCGYKLIQYMACGIPVIASPVGINSSIITNGINGFLATSTEEWREAFNILLKNPKKREEMGLAGRRLVEEQYSIVVTSPKLIELLHNASLK